jgi:hypothetical protein
MSRKRTGTLIPKPSGWFAQMWVDRDGVSRRELIFLGTTDKVIAKRKMATLARGFAEGRIVAELKEAALAPDTVESAARAWVDARKARGVEMADTELGYFVHHVFPRIGAMPVTEVRKVHIKRVLEGAAETKSQKTGTLLGRETIGHIKRLLGRFFDSLEADEVIASSPVRLVKMPAVKVDKRKRTLPTDEEYSALFAAHVNFGPTKKTGKPSTMEIEFFEMKVLAFTSRTLGGTRAAEDLRWAWEMIDRPGFETCRIARAKGGDVQTLEIPEILRPFLSGWWLACGCPAAGPVFPVSRGRRKGEARGKSNLAGRFRRALLRAGVTRHEVHNDTAYSRKTDFHTLRRAYVSALAKVGANEATSMALAHHHDSRVHQRYQLEQIQSVPRAALPQIAGYTSPPEPQKQPPVANARSVSGDSVMITERDTGFEPATSSLGSTCIVHIDEPMRDVASVVGVAGVAVRRDETQGEAFGCFSAVAFHLAMLADAAIAHPEAARSLVAFCGVA